MAQNGTNMTLKWVRLGLWAAVGLSLLALAVTYMLRTGPAPLPKEIGGPFKLTAHTGEVVDTASFHGKVQVIYFGFTYCPDICPTSLQTIAQALELAGEEVASQVQPVLVSLDPERDTPEVLKNYVEYFVPGMVGFTGLPSEIKTVADAYRVAFWKAEDPDSALPYTINHASFFFIMDRNGKFLKVMPTKVEGGVVGSNTGTPQNLAIALTEAVSAK